MNRKDRLKLQAYTKTKENQVNRNDGLYFWLLLLTCLEGNGEEGEGCVGANGVHKRGERAMLGKRRWAGIRCCFIQAHIGVVVGI